MVSTYSVYLPNFRLVLAVTWTFYSSIDGSSQILGPRVNSCTPIQSRILLQSLYVLCYPYYPRIAYKYCVYRPNIRLVLVISYIGKTYNSRDGSSQIFGLRVNSCTQTYSRILLQSLYVFCRTYYPRVA
jgi:hypothetical protein